MRRLVEMRREVKNRIAGSLLSCAVLMSSLGTASADAPHVAGIIPRIVLASDATLEARSGRACNVRVRISDPANDRALSALRVVVTISGGDASLDGLRRVETTTDENGVIELHVVPGALDEAFRLHVRAGDSTQDLELRIRHAPQRAIVVGLATAGVGSVPALSESPGGSADGAQSRRGSLSLYGSGTVARNTQATIAYRTADTLEQNTATGPFVDDPNDRPFPTYGDTSARSDDALSRTHIFARVANGASRAMYGEFAARSGTPDSAGGYDILVNGARVDTQVKNTSAGVFYARNDVAFDRVVFTPTGLGIASRLLRPDIVVGSDVVTSVSLDRRTGAIVSQRPLSRGTDYVLDYSSGQLRFINVLLPYDEEFNPHVVVVQYEYGGPGVRASFTGAHGALSLGPRSGAARLDTWYLNDATGAGNLSLFGQQLHGESPAADWSISHERSNGLAPVATVQYGSSGDRYRAALSTHGGPLGFEVHVDATGAGYANPYAGFASPGLFSFIARVRQRVSRIVNLELALQTAKNDVPGIAAQRAVANTDTSVRLGVRVTPSTRLSYHAHLVEETANGDGVVVPVTSFDGDAPRASIDPLALPASIATVGYTPGAGHGALLDAGLAWKFTRNATATLDRRQALSQATDPYDPPGTDLAIEIATSPGQSAFVRQRWQRASGDVLAASQQATAYAGTATSSTSIGFAQQFGTTTLESGYTVERTANGTDLYEAIGARRAFVLNSQLSGDAYAQAGRAFVDPVATTASAPNFLAFGTSLSYALKTFRATAQVQARTGFNGGSTYVVGAAGPVSPSISLFASYSGSYTQAFDTATLRAGASYRPVNNDRAVTLFSIDSRTGLANYDAYETNVAQLQELYRPARRTEFAASIGYKFTGDASFAPRTIVYGLRGDQRVGPRLDFGAEFHRSSTAPLHGVTATGLAVEGGYRLGNGVRFAGGFTFSGFADPTLAVAPGHRGVYATLSTYIDRILGWGKETARQ